jgi:phenylpropionate dioxygenase-like ring-hydroxylating dioxygenase large terminal subunit
VYVDNYLEGYHLPIAHPGLFKEIDYDQYRVETFRYYSKQHAPIRELKPGEVPGRDRRYIRMPGAEEDALYYWIFPNTMLNIYQDNLSTNVIVPLGADRTLTIFEWYYAEPGTGAGWESMQQTIAFSDEIQQEDIPLLQPGPVLRAPRERSPSLPVAGRGVSRAPLGRSRRRRTKLRSISSDQGGGVRALDDREPTQPATHLVRARANLVLRPLP